MKIIELPEPREPANDARLVILLAAANVLMLHEYDGLSKLVLAAMKEIGKGAYGAAVKAREERAAAWAAAWAADQNITEE